MNALATNLLTAERCGQASERKSSKWPTMPIDGVKALEWLSAHGHGERGIDPVKVDVHYVADCGEGKKIENDGFLRAS